MCSLACNGPWSQVCYRDSTWTLFRGFRLLVYLVWHGFCHVQSSRMLQGRVVLLFRKSGLSVGGLYDRKQMTSMTIVGPECHYSHLGLHEYSTQYSSRRWMTVTATSVTSRTERIFYTITISTTFIIIACMSSHIIPQSICLPVIWITPTTPS